MPENTLSILNRTRNIHGVLQTVIIYPSRQIPLLEHLLQELVRNGLQRPKCINEAVTGVETTKDKWFEAEVPRTAGEIALLAPEPDAAKSETHFERALCIAREQEAKFWEFRDATSMVRGDQGKPLQAHDLLVSVYGWFTEGFDTLDLKQARLLLKELA